MKQSKSCGAALAGVGIGLRQEHITEILNDKPAIPWLEVLTDNHMVAGGPARSNLEKICRHYPIALHSVGLSIGSTDPLDQGYLKQLKAMIDQFQPAWVSEHLCWSSVHGHHFHDLYPMPYTEEVIEHVAGRIREVQDYLGVQLLIENVSSYIEFKQSTMHEWEFVAAIAERSDCFLLFDVNNIYVSGHNHGYDPEVYLNALPIERVKQLHLAGCQERDGYLLDTHDQYPAERVWQLYDQVLDRFGAVPTLIEWDDNIPPLQELLAVRERAQVAMSKRCGDVTV